MRLSCRTNLKQEPTDAATMRRRESKWIHPFQNEIAMFLEKWKEKLDSGDEYYNKNLSLESDQYDVKLS